MSKPISPVSFRLKPELKKWLVSKAKSGDRSLNAEMNRTLKRIKEQEELQQKSA